MSENITNTIYLAGVFLILFASSELLYRKFKLKTEVTRKYVHFSTGLLTMLFPPFIRDHWLVLLLCASFLVILLLSLKFGFLPSVNAVKRETRGSLLFPVIVYSCFLVYTNYDLFIFYYIPILVLAVCDPAAALVGKKWPIGRYTTFGKTKTMSGSLSFFITAIITCLLLTILIDQIPMYNAFIISLSVAVVTALAEAVTHKGYDNLTIPAGAVLTLMTLGKFGLLHG